MLQARLGPSTCRASLQVRVLGVQAWTRAVAITEALPKEGGAVTSGQGSDHTSQGMERTPIQPGSCPRPPTWAAAGPGGTPWVDLLLSNPHETDTGEASASRAQMRQENMGLSGGREHHGPGPPPPP